MSASMKTGRGIQCLVFDWDGTLADSTSSIVSCMQAAIRATGLPDRSEQAIRDIIGLGLAESVRCLYPRIPDLDPETLVENYRSHYKMHYSGRTNLFPHVRQMLVELNIRGYLLAVATGKSRLGLDNSLRDTDSAQLFHVSRCADESLSKPHPQMLHEIMEYLGVLPESTLMIGDSCYDMQMARTAGCIPVAVTYGSQERHRLLEYNPVACLDSPLHLITWLDQAG